MPTRRRKPIVPSVWVDPTSDNEWQETAIPSILDIGQPVQPEPQKISPANQPGSVQFIGGVYEPIIEMSDEDDSSTSSESGGEPGQYRELNTVHQAQPNEEKDVAMHISKSEVQNPVRASIPFESPAVSICEEQSDDDVQQEGEDNLVPDGFFSHESDGDDESKEDADSENELELDPNEPFQTDDGANIDEEVQPQHEWQEQSINSSDREYVDYTDLKNKLIEDWLVVEIDHRVSKAASNAFWSLADSTFHKLYALKEQQNIKRNVPQFEHLRKILYKNNTPTIYMEVAYKNNETGEIITLQNIEKIPAKQYTKDKFTKLYEQASVKAEDLLKIHDAKCPNAKDTTNGFSRKVQYSCDAISECKSNAVSLDVYSFKMLNCRHIYPHKIVRPLNKTKVDHTQLLRDNISDLMRNQCKIAQYLADNPKRANARGCLNHASLYPCEYCYAKGVRIVTNKTTQEKNELQVKLTLITEKLASMSSSYSKEYKTLKNIQKKLQKEMNKISKKKSHIVWPSSTKDQELRTNSEMLNIAEKLENNENLTQDERKGVVNKSPLFDIPDFNFVKNVVVDYMHGVCIGVVKRLIELCFDVGDNRPRNSDSKLCLSEEFNKLMLGTKVLHDFPRRARELNLSVMKAAELRNVVLFYFPHVLSCMEPDAKEKPLWLYLAYMIRSCVLPTKEYQPIPLADIDYCCDKFYSLYEQLFGAINCTYNTYVVCSHLIEMRWHGPLTFTSTFPFESFYGDLRHSFTPGTQSQLKQMFQKVLVKKVLEHHCCEKTIHYSDRDTPLECNTLIYRFIDLSYHIYKVIKKDGGKLHIICQQYISIKFESMELYCLGDAFLCAYSR